MIKFILYMIIVYIALWNITEYDEKRRSKKTKYKKRHQAVFCKKNFFHITI